MDVPKSSANSMKRKADEIESTPSSNKEKIKQQTAKRSKPMFSGGASILEKLLPSSSSSNSVSVTARKVSFRMVLNLVYIIECYSLK